MSAQPAQARAVADGELLSSSRKSRDRSLNLGSEKASMPADFDAGEQAAAGVVLDRGDPELEDRGDLLGGHQLVEYRGWI
jgi:hypothetical protein